MDWAPGAGRDCTNGAISNSTPSPESKPRHRRGLERLDDVLRDNDNWLAGSGPLWGRQGLGEVGEPAFPGVAGHYGCLYFQRYPP